MGDGKALQMGTSHELGQNFARAFDIDYLDADGHAGAVLDDLVGLVHPHGRRPDHVPRRRRTACGCRRGSRPIQVVVLVVKRRGRRRRRGAAQLAAELDGARACASQLDDRVDTAFGRRAVDWELKGVPVRVEVGPRDLAEGVVTLVRRDRRTKEAVARGAARGRRDRPAGGRSRPTCWPRPRADRDARTADVATLDEAIEAGRDRLRPHPVGRPSATRARPRLAEHGITVRCLQRPDGGVPDDLEGPLVALVARAY